MASDPFAKCLERLLVINKSRAVKPSAVGTGYHVGSPGIWNVYLDNSYSIRYLRWEKDALWNLWQTAVEKSQHKCPLF